MSLSLSFVLTFFTREATLLFSLLNTVVIARGLGADAVGGYLLVVTGANLIALAGNLGLSSANTYSAARTPDKVGQLLVQSLLPLLLVLGVIGPLLLLLPEAKHLFLGEVDGVLAGFAILGGAALALNQNVAAILFGLHRMKRHSLVTFLPAFGVGTSSVILVLVLDLSLRWVLASWLGWVLASTALGLYLLGPFLTPLWPIERALLLESLALGCRTQVSAILAYASQRGSVLIINQLLGLTLLGYYSAAVWLAETLLHAPNALGSLVFSRTAARDHDPAGVARLLRLHFLASGAIAAALAAIAGWMVPMVFGEGYQAAVQPLRILLIGSYALGAWMIAGSHIAGLWRMPVPLIVASGLNLALNLVLATAWVPDHGLSGAAWAWSVATVLVSVMVLGYLLHSLGGALHLGDLVPGRRDLQEAWSAIRSMIASRDLKQLLPERVVEVLRPPVNQMRFRWIRLDPWKPWMRGRIDRTVSRAAAARQEHPRDRTAAFVADAPSYRESKLASGLRAAGWKVTLLTSRAPDPRIAAYYEDVVIFRDRWDALEKAAALAPAVHHVFANWNYLTAITFVENPPGKVVIDPADVIAEMFRPRTLIRVPGHQELERYCMENAHGICCRSIETQHLKRALAYRYRRRIFFPDYPVADGPVPPPRKQDGELHVVHIGSVGLERHRPSNITGHYLGIAEALARDGVHFHLYECPRIVVGSFEESYADFQELARRTPYFHLHRAIPARDLLARMGDYDFGIHVAGTALHFGDLDEDLTPANHATYLPNRIFEFLRAGLPIILHDGRFIGWYVNRFGKAHIADRGLLESPRQWLEARRPSAEDRRRLHAGSLAVDLNRHIPRLVRFYDSL